MLLFERRKPLVKRFRIYCFNDRIEIECTPEIILEIDDGRFVIKNRPVTVA